jgi:oligoribonuclease NrnB/cAMP/cGMP phosphodiesterase (DHH superfamily)
MEENNKRRGVLLEIAQDPRYLKLYETDVCFKNSIDYLLENSFSRDSVIEAVAGLSELLRKNQLLISEWERMYRAKYVEEQGKGYEIKRYY